MRFTRLGGVLAAILLLAIACDNGTFPRSGTLELVITGLPAGVAAEVAVFTPQGFSRTFTESGMVHSLPPGSYRAVPANVRDGDDEYAAVEGSANVTTGRTATIRIEYNPVTGGLDR